MNAAIEWIKSNVVTVVFIVIVIAALVVIPLLAGRMNDGIRQRMDERLQTLTALQSLERTPVEIGTESRTMLITPAILDQVEAMTAAEREDAEEILALAVEHNQKDRGVLNEELFPEPPPHRRELLPEQFHAEVVAAGRELLSRLGAGEPPSLESMKQELETKQAQFVAIELKKELSEPRTEEEQQALLEELSQFRLSEYLEAAASVGVYGNESALNLPTFNRQQTYSMSQLFEWQWQHWILQDVFSALAAANAEADSVLTAPVKRILNISVLPSAAAGAGDSGTGTTGGPTGGFGPAGMAGRGGGGGEAGAAGTAASPPNPAQPVPLDYNASFTGRVTNPLYDVRYVDLILDVAVADIPDVLDALAQQNFITVIDMAVMPVDPFELANAGYLYSSPPVPPIARISVRLETIWLRDWTARFMPREVKQALGVYDQPAASADPMG